MCQYVMAVTCPTSPEYGYVSSLNPGISLYYSAHNSHFTADIFETCPSKYLWYHVTGHVI